MPAADRLHADAVAVLGGWEADDDGQRGLRDDYLDHLARHPDGLWRDCHPDHLTASALVVDPARGAVLLTLHRRLGRWLQTGGHCERADVSLRGAARREAAEESGIESLAVDPAPLRLDRHRVPCGPLTPAQHLDVQHLAVAPAGALPRISVESLALEWFAYDRLPAETDASVHALVDAARQRLRTHGQASSVQGSPAASETPSR